MTPGLPCFHCGEPVPSGFQRSVAVRGVAQPMCCHGCAAITEAIVESGGEAYYDQRSTPGLAPGSLERLAPWAELFRDPDGFAQDDPAVPDSAADTPLSTATVAVEGLRCGACSWLIERSLAKVPGVRIVRANATTARLHLQWNPDQTSLEALAQRLMQLGYVLLPIGSLALEESRRASERQAVRRLFVAGLLSMQTMMLAMPHYVAPESLEPDIYLLLQWTACLLTIPALAYSGRPFFESAWIGLRQRQLNMDLPISIGLLLAFLGSLASLLTAGGPTYFESVPMFLLFVLGARQIEQRLRRDAMAQREQLALEPPAFARRLHPSPGVVAPWRLQAGDLLEVRSGDKLPADSVLVSESASLDLSALTGELRPSEHQAGELLPEGAINLGGPLQARVAGSGLEGTLARLGRLAEEAAAQRPDWTTWADQIAGRFTLGVLLLAVANSAWALWAQEPIDVWLPRLVAVLVVSCPCALSVAGPAAYAAALSRLLSDGIALSHPRGLESAWRLSDIAFDKTGTLTQPSHSQVRLETLGCLDEQEIARWVASLTEDATHPLARSLQIWARAALRSSEAARPRLTGMQAEAGLGLSATDEQGVLWRLGSPSWVSTAGSLPAHQGPRPSVGLRRGDQPVAWFWLDDRLRPEAQPILQALTESGIRPWILSGDDPLRVAQAAQQLGIPPERALGGLSPEAKRERLRALQREAAGRVAMVGDGLNDAPVLALADLSIAMRGSAPLAQQQADAYFLREGLLGLPRLLAVAQKTSRVLRQNLNWSLGYNLVAIPVAFVGLVSPLVAAAGMALSSLVVMLNARRLMSPPPSPEAGLNSPSTDKVR